MSASKTDGKNDKLEPPKEMVERYMKIAIEKAPEKIKPYLEKATPYFVKLLELIEYVTPIIYEFYLKALALWKKIEPYKPELLLPSFIGFVMCFFGGSFVATIAAVEAFKMVGGETIVDNVKILVSDFQKVVEASKKDDDKDEDGDGVKDVKQISSQELITRKTLLFLKVLDPKRVTNALAAINAGCMAIVATLQLQFARTITLGNSIANTLQKPADAYLLPLLQNCLPDEYKKWAEPVLSYSIKSAAISVAWTLQRIISAFHSAMKGGLMFSRNIMEYLCEMKIVSINHEDTVIDEIVGYALTFIGLFFQLRYGFSLPFPLNVLLFPVSLVEYFLIYTISK